LDINTGWAVSYNGTILKTIDGGGLVPVKDQKDNLESIKLFLLKQNYPNPFNPTTTIRFTISDVRFTILKVYDVLGNEIATLVNEEKPVGSYEVEFSATGGGNGLPSGIYFYQIRVGDYSAVKKMIYQK